MIPIASASGGGIFVSTAPNQGTAGPNFMGEVYQ